jgi:NhaP-type Na+/H+ or K+/H+ antiporter
MLLNMAILVILGLLFAQIFEKIKLPPLLGMILAGVLMGPYMRDVVAASSLHNFSFLFISDGILEASTELRTAALIVILIRAGLGINKEVLQKIGKIAFKMSAIPCLLEGLFITLFAHYMLGFSLAVSGVLAFVIAAVSPAVIVPEMLSLKENNYGKEKEIPTIILAGASIDDVFAITLFGVFLSMGLGDNIDLSTQLLSIPVSIITGVLGGIILGYALYKLFDKFHFRDTKKAIIFMVVAILYHHLEELKIFPIASLIGVMAMGFMVLEKSPNMAKNIASKFNKIWVFAEIILFTLIGAAVDLSVLTNTGAIGLMVILVGLIGRWIGVAISLRKSGLNTKEKIFCKIAYSPKATVQAAIGGVPLAMGLPHGEVILAIAVLSIVVTAPLGAIGIRVSKDRFLDKYFK